MKIAFASLLAFLLLFFCITHVNHFSDEMLLETQGIEDKSLFNFELINEIVSKPLSYIGYGHEAIVFVSQDDQYVLKFFLKEHIYKKRFFKPKKRIKQLFFHGNEIRKGPESLKKYEVGFDLLKNETGLIAVHANKTIDNLPSCTLIDYRGKEHVVDLNQVAFIVQRKAKVITKHMIAEKFESVNRNLLELFSKLAQKGFVSKSRIFKEINFAILDEVAVMIDIGKLEFLPQHAYLEEETRLKEKYSSWLAKNLQK